MGPDMAIGTGVRCPSVLVMLQGTFCCKLSRNGRPCGDAGIESGDPDASGIGRECCWACKATLSKNGRWQHCCRTGSAGHRTEPRALHGNEHLAGPGDEHLAVWDMASGFDQAVEQPVLGDNALCAHCLPSLPHVLTRAEPGYGEETLRTAL